MSEKCTCGGSQGGGLVLYTKNGARNLSTLPSLTILDSLILQNLSKERRKNN